MVPQHVEMVPQYVEMVPQHQEMALQPLEMAPQHKEMVPQPLETVPQYAEMAPQHKEMAPQQAFGELLKDCEYSTLSSCRMVKLKHIIYFKKFVFVEFWGCFFGFGLGIFESGSFKIMFNVFRIGDVRAFWR